MALETREEAGVLDAQGINKIHTAPADQADHAHEWVIDAGTAHPCSEVSAT